MSISLSDKDAIDNANNYPEDYIISQETRNRVKMLSSENSIQRHPVIATRKSIQTRN